MGATHTINYRRTPTWEAEVMRITEGAGAHHIFDNVGINEIEKCFDCVAPGGVITTIGFLGGDAKTTPNVPMLALFRQASLRGISGGSKRHFEELLRFAELHRIHPRVDRVFPFDQAIEALEYLGSGQHFGKVVIRVSSI
ncbi:unnamed protein product [Peniophora sp. CBMAI 1063]|nr:unnamed protein product [Peniophora sp. CBMAI 1063]